MSEILALAGIGFASAILEMFLSANGKSQEAKLVGVAALSAALVIVINLFSNVINMAVNVTRMMGGF